MLASLSLILLVLPPYQSADRGKSGVPEAGPRQRHPQFPANEDARRPNLLGSPFAGRRARGGSVRDLGLPRGNVRVSSVAGQRADRRLFIVKSLVTAAVNLKSPACRSPAAVLLQTRIPKILDSLGRDSVSTRYHLPDKGTTEGTTKWKRLPEAWRPSRRPRRSGSGQHVKLTAEWRSRCGAMRWSS